MVFNYLEIGIALFVGLTVMVMVFKKPKLFWYMLIIVNIVGNGPRLMGYFFWDELLTGCIIIGAFLRVQLLRTKIQKSLHAAHNHKSIFFMWVLYMTMESVIGIIANNDIRIIRWGFFYVELGLLSSILYYRGREFPFPNVRSVSLVIIITTVIYYISYIAHGVIFELILGYPMLGRFAAQYLTEGFLWSGTAMAIFPTLVAMPIAIYLMNDRSFKVRTLVLFSVSLMMAVGFFYDSRLSWVIIFAICLASYNKFNFALVIKTILVFGLVVQIFMTNPFKQIGAFFYTIFEGTQMLWSPGKSDLSRQLQFEAGLMRLTSNPKTFLIGDGIYSHRITIGPYVDELYNKHLDDNRKFNIPGYEDMRAAKDIGPDGKIIYRTTAFSAFAIDTGIIGLTLFYLNYLFIGYKLIKQKSNQRINLLVTLFIAFMWPFNNNISEVLFLYILVMPCGLLQQLSFAMRSSRPRKMLVGSAVEPFHIPRNEATLCSLK